MERSQVILLTVSVTCLILALFRIFSNDQLDYRDFIAKAMEKSTEFNQMKESAKREFATAKVIRVNPEVTLAIGYALANVILIHGPDGCAVVDTTESAEAALAARNALEKELRGPCKVTDIVYTHNHADHTQGAKVFQEWVPKSIALKIWAHKDLPRLVEHSNLMTSAVTFIRAMRQFGAMIPKTHSSGIGMDLKFNANFTTAYLPPTHFLEGSSANITLAGLQVQLIHIPGETDDQIAVYIPSSRSVLCADDIYKAFPNLYAIRGTTFRSHVAWLSSIEKMMDLKAEHLVPSHTLPVSGAAKIQSILLAYRDAVQFVHDQTVRYINRDMGPDEIAHHIGTQLAPGLRAHPYLKPLYGTIPWSVKGLYSGYMGWFSGRAEELEPQLPSQRARKLVTLGGGPGKVLTVAEEALAEGDFQWALELATAVKTLKQTLSSRDLAKATDLRIKALIELAHRQTSTNGYNYLMTSAYEDMGIIEVKLDKRMIQKRIHEIPIDKLFRMLSLRFRGEICNENRRIVQFTFTDTKKSIELLMRNGIMIVRTQFMTPNADVEVETTETIWREILSGERNAAYAVAVSGAVKVKPGAFALKEVMDCFDRVA